MDGWIQPMIEKREAEALALVVAACRPAKATRWDQAGVMAALAKVRHLALADVAMAAIRAAADSTVKTPGVLGNPTTHHWREKVTEPTSTFEPYDVAKVCGICDQPRRRCTTNPHSGHDFIPKPAVLANAKPRPEMP